VPWGIVFLSSGDALVSERDSGRIVRISRGGRVRAIGEVAGAVGASSGGEGGLMGIALAPGDEETLFAFVTTDSDDRIVRCSLAGGRVGRPRAILTGIASRTRHHGGRLLFDRAATRRTQRPPRTDAQLRARSCASAPTDVRRREIRTATASGATATATLRDSRSTAVAGSGQPSSVIRKPTS
jgi:hypothetical protein